MDLTIFWVSEKKHAGFARFISMMKAVLLIKCGSVFCMVIRSVLEIGRSGIFN